MIVIEFSLATTEPKRAQCIAALKRQMQATRAEPGCVSYRFTADLDDPNVFHLVELWEDEAALVAHLKTASLAAFVAELADFGRRLDSVARQGTLMPYTIPRNF